MATATVKREQETDQFARYTDLQPVGMGAFGLVWYVHVCSMVA
jgi:hypothetical protein